MSIFYGRCAGCKKDKFFVRKRTYVVPKLILDKHPELSAINGMKSDGELCGQCFKSIIKITLPQ